MISIRQLRSGMPNPCPKRNDRDIRAQKMQVRPPNSRLNLYINSASLFDITNFCTTNTYDRIHIFKILLVGNLEILLAGNLEKENPYPKIAFPAKTPNAPTRQRHQPLPRTEENNTTRLRTQQPDSSLVRAGKRELDVYTWFVYPCSSCCV